MEIVVKGRNVEVPDHFRTHVAEKLTRVERYDSKIIGVDVELSHETNRRQAKNCQRVQITLETKGPVVRAEASAETFYAALDSAVHKLESQLRKAADRRHDRARTPALAVAASPEELAGPDERSAADEHDHPEDAGPGRVVRIKDHPGDPITVDQALYRMELVGHDFYLFLDAETQLSSVVYRRRGFDYGLLRLAEAGSGVGDDELTESTG
ncbi:ribosome hibernation-promoting factor, HPF/YfiA family [Nakamurella lactea]|uniref:ribosome hibernation-promoting factor, HPF/YfiA family n=1 Tax=Nakamurella lactea TaxID=459515 RepID=UPI00040EA219|nr:ribosome-associated translation inhibitor RaiA [Nakamurella lactea]